MGSADSRNNQSAIDGDICMLSVYRGYNKHKVLLIPASGVDGQLASQIKQVVNVKYMTIYVDHV